jgi:hypothetical protein
VANSATLTFGPPENSMTDVATFRWEVRTLLSDESDGLGSRSAQVPLLCSLSLSEWQGAKSLFPVDDGKG